MSTIYPECDLERWCVEPSSYIADADNYYTKAQVDELITEESGITSGDVETLIEESISGKADTSAVTAVNDVVTAHTADSTIHVTASDKENWDNKLDASAYTPTVYSAGRGISIDSADTISFSLPISAGTGELSVAETLGTASGRYSHAEGGGFANGLGSHAEGNECQANNFFSHAEGNETIANGIASHAEGIGTQAKNNAEHASGQYNVSSSASTTFGNSGNTLFSVGNGTSTSRHNALEIRENGDIYLNDGAKLQDTVSATTANTTALGGLKFVSMTQQAYDNLQTKDNNTIYFIIE